MSFPIEGPFQEFKLSIEVPQNWADSTWDQDVTPSITSQNGEVRIAVDSEDCFFMRAELGDDSETKRFYVTLEDGTDIGGCDTLEEALRLAAPYLIN